MTLVLFGSLGSTREMWEPQQEVLAGRDVVYCELPGHGAEPLAEVPDLDVLVQRVLDRVPGTFSFAGVSFGGAVGMRLAAVAPERVEKLALLCTAPKFGEPAGWHERAALVRAEGLEAIADGTMGRWFTPVFADVERWREMVLSVDPEGYARCCEALAATDLWTELPEIAAPTLVVAGAQDPSTPPEIAERIAAAIPGARLEVIEGAAHLASIERPDAVNRLLEAFLVSDTCASRAKV